MDEVVSADASGRFSIALEEPAASGYSWTPATLPPGVGLEGDEVTPGGAALGGVRRHVFRFVATQPGRFKLDFELRRPWQEQATENRQVQVEVGA